MIKKLILQNEDKTLEFKENSSSLNGIIKTVVAFANTAGGIIAIGIEDKTKTIVGVKDSLLEEERLTNAISDSISPFIIPNIEIQTYKKKEIILISVPHLPGPVYVKKDGPEKGVYVRFGSTNRVADAEMLHNLRLYTKKITFDEIPYLYSKIDSLDWEFIKDKFKKVKKNLTESKAEDLGLLAKHGEKIVPTHGGIILFGKNRHKIFPNAIIRCVRYLGDNKARVLDNLDINSYPIDALKQAEAFVTKNTFTSADFSESRRKDIPQYPTTAIKEALVNAIMHSDYSITGSYIMVSIFDNRIEITNPGGLPFGMTLDKAIAGSSRARNRVIARTFRELKLTEQWGSGLQRIIESCKEYDLDPPKFEDLFNEFQVTLYSPIEARRAKLNIDYSQKQLISHLKNKKSITAKDAAAFLNTTAKSAQLKLKNLVNAGLIKKAATSTKYPKGAYILKK